MQFYSLADFLFGPIALLIILIIARGYARRKKEVDPMYKYYLSGLTVKLIGEFGLCIVYTLYYPGGDTFQYYYDGGCFVKLLFQSPSGFIHIITHTHDLSDLVFFNSE